MMMSRSSIASVRRAYARTYSGKMTIVEPSYGDGELGPTVTVAERVRDVRCRVNPVTVEEKIEGLDTLKRRVVRCFCHPDADVRLNDKVDLSDYLGRPMGRWEVLETTKADSEPSAEMVVLCGQAIDDSSKPAPEEREDLSELG